MAEISRVRLRGNLSAPSPHRGNRQLWVTAPSGLWLAVHQRRIPAGSENSQHDLLDESHRMLLRQRCHGTLLLVTQARMDVVRILRRHHPGKTQRLPVHRNVLQLKENPPVARILHTRRSRRTPSSKTRRLKLNSGVHSKWATAGFRFELFSTVGSERRR